MVRTVSHYEVLEKLGEGGMGEVYKARDPRLNRLVAIKGLPSDKVASPDRKARLIQEARAASALNHPNIITVYDVASQDGCECIVMEYVAGPTLAGKIAAKELRLPDVLKYGAQIANALARAHAAGIVHRDLKPSNTRMGTPGGYGERFPGQSFRRFLWGGSFARRRTSRRRCGRAACRAPSTPLPCRPRPDARPARSDLAAGRAHN